MPKLFVAILSKSTDGLTFSPLWFCGCVHRVGPKEVYNCEYTVYSCTIYLFIMVLFSICTVSYFCLTLCVCVYIYIYIYLYLKFSIILCIL